MPNRYRETSPLFVFSRLKLASALREKWKQGYYAKDFQADLMAGLVVAVIAIPLAMALAVASGVAPQNGLYTVIIGGTVVALLGGSRFQVSGPTAAFVVILAPIAHKFGLSGLLIAGGMAGVILILMGVAGFGQFIQFIPHPVTTGFTSGIAVVIATIQLKDFFGLSVGQMPDHYFGRLAALFNARNTWDPWELAVGAFTLFALWYWPRVNKRIPAPLVVLTAVSAAVWILQKNFPGIQIATIQSRFSGIPRSLPQMALPWTDFSFDTLRSLASSAIAIAMLGAIESLLSATVADGMSQTKHDPDGELVALGIGNLLCPLFGGIAATGAIARTATNIRYGARSPISAIIHAVFTLLIVLLFAPYVSMLPMAALAALLLRVAYNMSEAKHFTHILKVAPRSDVIVLLLCFILTVVFDMVIGVTFGLVAASLLFMRRMVTTTSVEQVGATSHAHLQMRELPKGVMVYEIAGPLFFGAAEKAMDALARVSADVESVIFLMDGVPNIDMTGLVAFESAIEKLTIKNKRVFLVGVRNQPNFLLHRAGVLTTDGPVRSFATLDSAIQATL